MYLLNNKKKTNHDNFYWAISFGNDSLMQNFRVSIRTVPGKHSSNPKSV